MTESKNRFGLQPRPKLLVLLFVIFFLWVGGLLWMYFSTVYPLRHPAARHSGSTSLPTTSGE